MLGYLILMGFAGIFKFFFFSSQLQDTLECLIFRCSVKFCPVWTKLRGLGEGERFVGNGTSGAAAELGWKPREASSWPPCGTKQTHCLSGLRSVAQ